ncbi:protein TIFY 5A [Cucumis sativus]|uniref:Protein TIFY n=1 Tax=Cucumis sativus TaxID=3659 RepID=A0A0A0LXJ5_CUCSA|nr:protein TIFY 5A [Cucumis sativus]
MALLPVSIDHNCNLELRLSPSSSTFLSHPLPHSHHHPPLHHFLDDDDECNKNSHQQMTIFYNGRVCVADFTEDQAKAIIMLASRQVEDRSTNPEHKLERPSTSPDQCHREPVSLSVSGSGSGSGLSMKRSLQRFLQKRKNRIQSASPYNH